MPHRKTTPRGQTVQSRHAVVLTRDFSLIPSGVRQRVFAPNHKALLDEKSWHVATQEFLVSLQKFLDPAGVIEVRTTPDKPFIIEIVVLPANEHIAHLRMETFISQNLSRRHRR
jgi:hypothetical protein